MTPVPTRRQVLTEMRRHEILAAALKLFGKKGFEATRAEDIAAAAKMAKGTLYLYFESKEEIYTAAIQLAVSQLQELVTERAGAAQGVREKLAAVIVVRLEFWGSQQGLYRLLLTLGREARHRKQTAQLLWMGHDSFLSILEEGVSAGEVPAQNFEGLAWALLDMIRGANERRLDGVTCRTVQEDAATITGIALRQLGLPPA